MKHILLFLLIGFVVYSCKKDKVPTPIVANYYQSNGNLLILKVDENLESVYEYNLASTVLYNDSLPLYYETYSDGIYNYTYWKFLPNPDTLLLVESHNSAFFTAQINNNE